MNYLETKNKIQKPVPSGKGCFVLALIKTEGVSVCMCGCVCVCVCAHAHVFVSVPVFVLRPLLFPPLECRTSSLWSECKIDQIEFTDGMPFLPFCLTEEISTNFGALSGNTASL